jgi:hypothetical protein
MAITSLAALGPSVAIWPEGEIRVAALADGTAKPGDAVGMTNATTIVQTDVGGPENFVGFLDLHYATANATAPVATTPISIIKPQSGHNYRVHIEDPAGTEYPGTPYTFSDTAGTMEAATAAILGLATLAKTVGNGDTYAEITWL